MKFEQILSIKLKYFNNILLLYVYHEQFFIKKIILIILNIEQIVKYLIKKNILYLIIFL